MKPRTATGHIFALAFALLLAATTGCHDGTSGPPESEYAGQEERDIKTLSPSEISGYLEGRGMGFSKVAELNQHPGPKHVLELTEALGLTGTQRQAVQQVFRDMEARAQELGQRLVAKERRLDRLFASGDATEPETEALLREIGTTRAQLRFAHVRAHMRTREILSPRQVEQYDEARGYNASGRPRHHQHGHGV